MSGIQETLEALGHFLYVLFQILCDSTEKNYYKIIKKY